MGVVCSVIFAALLIFDLMLLLIMIISLFFKRVIASDGVIWAWIMFIAFPMAMEYGNYVIGSKPMWGLTLFNSFFLVYIGAILYFMLKDVVILGKGHLWKCNCFPLFKRYTYEDIIGYTIKLTSGHTGIQKMSKSHPITVAAIYFSDNTFVEIDFPDMKCRKMNFLKKVFKEKKCRRNGRCRRNKNNKGTFFNTPVIVRRSSRK